MNLLFAEDQDCNESEFVTELRSQSLTESSLTTVHVENAIRGVASSDGFLKLVDVETKGSSGNVADGSRKVDDSAQRFEPAETICSR